MNLKEFGQVFLGPLLLQYCRTVLERDTSKVFSLAREGYLFDRVFKETVLSSKISSQYLKVSRALLFRVLAGDSDSWKYSLKPSFGGTFADLLIARFGMSPLFVDRYISPVDLEKQIELPEDIGIASKLLSKYREQIESNVALSKTAYLDYLKAIGFVEGATLLDLGYSGTIQRLLTLLTEQNTKGLYFIASNPGEHRVGENLAQMTGVFAQNVEMGNGSLMLDRSMFLESLLTAPEGQLKDIRKNPLTGEFEFFYGKRANTQKHFHELEQVFEGAIEHVKHCLKHDISYSKEEIHHLFNQFVTKRSMFPAITWKLFEIDDAVSGNGNVDPLAFFGL